MKNMMMIFAVAAIALISCGDNLKVPDAGIKHDAPTDAFCSNCPPPPTLGAQIDRMGRPAVNTALNHAFDPSAGAGSAKDLYNQDATPSGWRATWRAQFAGNLAVVDSLDTGIACNDGMCPAETVATPGDRCGNQVEYNGMPGGQIGSASATSYLTLASILADDQLYLDTTKTSCEIASSHQNYLAYEFKVVTTSPNSTCGGRAPTNDVMDTSYTALAIGITGFKVSDGSFAPFINDGVGPHADVTNDVFPFFGTPH